MRTANLIARAEQRAIDVGVDAWKALMLVLLEEIAETEVPAEVVPAMATAQRFWLGADATAEDLLVAKTMCWRYLDKLPKSDLNDPSGRKVRSLLCVMDPAGDYEAISDTAEWFVAVTEH